MTRQKDRSCEDVRLARDPPETGGECSDRLLHCEDGAEPGRSLDNALISLRSFGQRVGLDYRFNSSLGYVIQGFVKVFRAILLAADDFDALEEQLDQRDRKRLRVSTHNDEPAVWAQSLNAVHHGFGPVGCPEDNIA